MSLRKTLLAAAAAIAFTAGIPGVAAQAQTTTPPPPASAWAREAAMASVTVSPDGQHVAAIISPDGRQRAVAVWRTDAMDQAPYLIGSDDRSEFLQVQFVKNNRLFVTQQYVSNYTATGQVLQTYRYRTQLVDLEGNPIRTPRWDGADDRLQAQLGVGSLISTLANHPTDILVSDPFRGDVYRYNTTTGDATRVERGSDRFDGLQSDLTGEIRVRSEFGTEGGQAYIAVWIKDQNDQWAEHFRWSARDREPISIVGFSTDPNIAYVLSTQGRDHAAIYEYDIAARQLGEPAFAHPLFDATDVIQSRDPAHYGEILGFSYDGERSQVYWAEPALEQAMATLRQALGVTMEPVSWVDIASGERMRFEAGDGADISINSFSNDLSTMIVEKSGPSQPPEYYLIQNGRARLLGRAYPEIDVNAIGSTELIQYAARDGLEIPAFLTTPNPAIYGDGPYPTIITPHGGPWARDQLDWDPTGWTQYFAARGYAVLQPQYRGSEGWGQRLWRAGDSEWGGRMQDDKDDGVRYLIERGIADPGRVAMHGYSYGGYASMVAAVRPNGLYQCAVAGAGPSSLNDIRQDTYNNRFIREFQHPYLNGMSPIEHVDEISIPIYLYSGDRDTRVEPAESERLEARLRAAGKPVTLRILPDMEHTLNTWTPANTELMLTSVEEYLRTQCGPDGL